MKNFNDIYAQILEGSKKELENLRKEFVLRLIVTIIVIVGLVLLLYEIFANDILASIVFFASIVISAVFMAKYWGKYTEVYKEKVVKSFINFYDENLKYDYNYKREKK